MKLTDIAIRALRVPDQGQKDYWDETLPCFGVRVSQGGSKTFILMKRDSRKAIGRYPHISLSQARTEAKRQLAELTLGKVQPPSVTFKELVDLFFSIQCTEQRNKPRTIYDYRRLLSRHFLSRFSQRQLSDISHEHISLILDSLQPTPIEANHAFISIRALFRFAERRRLITSNPCQGLSLPSKAVARNRTLSDEEIASVYAAATSYPFGTIVRLLILTGQRRTEMGSLQWGYIERDTMTLPKELTKNNREHTFPIGARCAALLKTIPRQNSPYLFPARGKPDKPFNGWSKAKKELDEVCPLPHWTLHDLRRTVSTNLAALGTAPHVTERLLNHASGTVSGVAAIYNKYQYLAEVRTALEAWEKRLFAMVGEEA